MLLKALRQLSGFSMVPYFARRHCTVVALRVWLIGAEYDWLAKRGSGIEGSERLDELLGWYSCWFGGGGPMPKTVAAKMNGDSCFIEDE